MGGMTISIKRFNVKKFFIWYSAVTEFWILSSFSMVTIENLTIDPYENEVVRSEWPNFLVCLVVLASNVNRFKMETLSSWVYFFFFERRISERLSCLFFYLNWIFCLKCGHIYILQHSPHLFSSTKLNISVKIRWYGWKSMNFLSAEPHSDFFFEK